MPCSNDLLLLRDAIKKELDSEEAAGQMYRDMAKKFIELEEPQKAVILRLMAGQEEFHRVALETVVEAIDQKCGG